MLQTASAVLLQRSGAAVMVTLATTVVLMLPDAQMANTLLLVLLQMANTLLMALTGASIFTPLATVVHIVTNVPQPLPAGASKAAWGKATAKGAADSASSSVTSKKKHR